MTEDASRIIEIHRRYLNPGWADLVEAIGIPVGAYQAQGSWLVAKDGSGLLDMLAGFGATVLGHNHPRLISALHHALDRGTPMTAPMGLIPQAGRLAERLVELAGPALGKVHFGSSGAEAIDTALKLAAGRTGRKRFVRVAGGFHGLSVGATALAGANWWRMPFPDIWLEAAEIVPGDLKALEEALSRRDVAALVLEIVPGSDAGDGWPNQALLQAQALCRQAGALLVIDEVQTAFGRTGSWFAFQQAEGLQPDMVIVSKALTGGIVPLSAVLMTDDIFHATFGPPGQARIHGSTFAGNRLAMECGLAVLALIEEENLVRHAQTLGQSIRERLASAGVRLAGRGLLLAAEIGRDAAEANGRCLDIVRSGVLVSTVPHAPTFIRITPALNLTEEEAELFIQAVARTMAT